jgi:hypothetical protein
MAFIPPTFNLVCDIWRNAQWRANWPLFTAAPTIVNQPCQLRVGSLRVNALVNSQEGGNLSELLVPALTDVRQANFQTSDFPAWYDVVECPSGSSRFFFIVAVTDVAKGFSNEYRVAVVEPSVEWESAIYAGRPLYPYAPPWPLPYP